MGWMQPSHIDWAVLQRDNAATTDTGTSSASCHTLQSRASGRGDMWTHCARAESGVHACWRETIFHRRSYIPHYAFQQSGLTTGAKRGRLRGAGGILQ